MSTIEHPHSLAQESIDHDNRARYLAAAAVRDFQRGNQRDAMHTMATCAMERHLAYEKWDTARIAWDAQDDYLSSKFGKPRK